jgi:uncharacterized protein
MQNNPNSKLLRIYIGENDKYQQHPLYETIVFEARKQGLSGATVTRGIMGFGANSKKIHTTKLFEISSDLPLIIEIVDIEEKVKEFVKSIERLLENTKSGVLVTIEKVEVVRYNANK